MRLYLGASGTFSDANRESRRTTSAGTNIKTRITIVCVDVNSGGFSCSSLDAILADLVSFSDNIEDHSRPHDKRLNSARSRFFILPLFLRPWVAGGVEQGQEG